MRRRPSGGATAPSKVAKHPSRGTSWREATSSVGGSRSTSSETSRIRRDVRNSVHN